MMPQVAIDSSRRSIDDIRKELARVYNAFFASAPVADRMIRLELELIEWLSEHDGKFGRMR